MIIKNYTFWIETYDGRYIQWRRLTKAQAKGMYISTQKSTPETIKRYGWEETK